MMRISKGSPTYFVMTVTLENTLSVLLGLVFSMIIGGISSSSLAAIGLIGTMQNVLLAIMAFLTTGAPVLTARFVGEKNREQAKLAAEQSVALALYVGIAVAILCEVTAVPLLRLLLPNAEEVTFTESLVYYRIQMISFPMLLISNTICGVMRAAGEPKSAFVCTMVLNLFLLAATWFMVGKLQMGVAGAAWSFLVCRLPGMLWMLFSVTRYKQEFSVAPRKFLRLNKEMAMHITRIGFPPMLESLGVQMGYLIANSMAMGLGTHGAAVFQVSTTTTNFATISVSIGTVCAITFVGQKLGANDYEGAKRSQRKVLTWCMSVGVLCGVLLAAFGGGLTALFTDDVSIQQESAKLLWLMIGYNITAVAINVNDPVLRTAGDMKCVMWYTLICVWLVRLPLTWLFCSVLDYGAMGVQLANIISLSIRTVCGLVRIGKGKWVYLKV